MQHKLHKEVRDILDNQNFQNCKIIFDQACGGQQNIPLFCTSYKSQMTEYCNVDALILQENKIEIIIEIDESNIKPTHICGKFLTSAISKYYIHETEKEPIGMSDSVLFIQIVATDNLELDLTSKIEQFRNLEESIQKIIPLEESNITKYLLYPVINNKSIDKFLSNVIMKHLTTQSK